MLESEDADCLVLGWRKVRFGNAWAGPRCPLRVKRVDFAMSALGPVCPQQQTFSDPVGTSHLGQSRTPLVVGDPLVAAIAARPADGAAKLLAGLEDRGEQALRGRSGAVRIWTHQGAPGFESRT